MMAIFKLRLLLLLLYFNSKTYGNIFIKPGSRNVNHFLQENDSNAYYMRQRRSQLMAEIENEDVPEELIPVLDMSCIIKGVAKPQDISNGHFLRYSRKQALVNLSTKPTRKGFLVALYACADGYEFLNGSTDKLYCSKRTWIGMPPVCSKPAATETTTQMRFSNETQDIEEGQDTEGSDDDEDDEDNDDVDYTHFKESSYSLDTVKEEDNKESENEKDDSEADNGDGAEESDDEETSDEDYNDDVGNKPTKIIQDLASKLDDTIPLSINSIRSESSTIASLKESDILEDIEEAEANITVSLTSDTGLNITSEGLKVEPSEDYHDVITGTSSEDYEVGNVTTYTIGDPQIDEEALQGQSNETLHVTQDYKEAQRIIISTEPSTFRIENSTEDTFNKFQRETAGNVEQQTLPEFFVSSNINITTTETSDGIAENSEENGDYEDATTVTYIDAQKYEDKIGKITEAYSTGRYLHVSEELETSTANDEVLDNVTTATTELTIIILNHTLQNSSKAYGGFGSGLELVDPLELDKLDSNDDQIDKPRIGKNVFQFDGMGYSEQPTTTWHNGNSSSTQLGENEIRYKDDEDYEEESEEGDDNEDNDDGEIETQSPEANNEDNDIAPAITVTPTVNTVLLTSYLSKSPTATQREVDNYTTEGAIADNNNVIEVRIVQGSTTTEDQATTTDDTIEEGEYNDSDEAQQSVTATTEGTVDQYKGEDDSSTSEEVNMGNTEDTTMYGTLNNWPATTDTVTTKDTKSLHTTTWNMEQNPTEKNIFYDDTSRSLQNARFINNDSLRDNATGNARTPFDVQIIDFASLGCTSQKCSDGNTEIPTEPAVQVYVSTSTTPDFLEDLGSEEEQHEEEDILEIATEDTTEKDITTEPLTVSKTDTVTTKATNYELIQSTTWSMEQNPTEKNIFYDDTYRSLQNERFVNNETLRNNATTGNGQTPFDAQIIDSSFGCTSQKCSDGNTEIPAQPAGQVNVSISSNPGALEDLGSEEEQHEEDILEIATEDTTVKHITTEQLTGSEKYGLENVTHHESVTKKNTVPTNFPETTTNSVVSTITTQNGLGVTRESTYVSSTVSEEPTGTWLTYEETSTTDTSTASGTTEITSEATVANKRPKKITSTTINIPKEDLLTTVVVDATTDISDLWEQNSSDFSEVFLTTTSFTESTASTFVERSVVSIPNTELPGTTLLPNQEMVVLDETTTPIIIPKESIAISVSPIVPLETATPIVPKERTVSIFETSTTSYVPEKQLPTVESLPPLLIVNQTVTDEYVPPIVELLSTSTMHTVLKEGISDPLLPTPTIYSINLYKEDDSNVVEGGTTTIPCPDGFNLGRNGRCNDVNECRDRLHNCSDFCENTIGSYRCFCPAGYQLANDRHNCEDLNECVKRPCSHDCINEVGSFRCDCPPKYYLFNRTTCIQSSCSHGIEQIGSTVKCSCPDGFRLDRDNSTCEDVDECSLRVDSCQHICENSAGSFRCHCSTGFVLNSDGKTCRVSNPCSTNNGGCSQLCMNRNGSAVCECFASHKLKPDGKTCTRINPCQLNNGGCSHGCAIHNGAVICLCPEGFSLIGMTCETADPCSVKNGNCSHKCLNIKGEAFCACPPGFTLHGRNCRKYDPCLVNNGDCSHKCTNFNGKARCSCPEGYFRNGKTCEYNSCLLNNGGCSHFCVFRKNVQSCQCPNGYKLRPNRKTCQIRDDCLGCSHYCTATQSGGMCYCPGGFNLKSDGKTCADVNECAFGNGGCQHTCHNVPGSFKCTCHAGFTLQSNGTCALKIYGCGPLQSPTNGNVKCLQLGLASNYKPGTQCVFWCNIGYQLRGHSLRTCDSSGSWTGIEIMPECIPISCAPLGSVDNGRFLPQLCNSERSYPGQTCELHCDPGFKTVTGFESFTCLSNLHWNGVVAERSLREACVKDAAKTFIRCPSDGYLNYDLPRGQDTMLVDIPQPTTNVEWPRYVTAKPDWGVQLRKVLTPGRTEILYNVHAPGSNSSDNCTLVITIKGREEPKIVKCPYNITYRLLDNENDKIIYWIEPEFSDNVAVTGIYKSKESGTRFPPGFHQVFYIAHDAAGNKAKCYFTVNIIKGTDDHTQEYRAVLICPHGNRYTSDSPNGIEEGATVHEKNCYWSHVRVRRNRWPIKSHSYTRADPNQFINMHKKRQTFYF